MIKIKVGLANIDKGSVGCDIIGQTNNSRNMEDMLCRSKANAEGNPCFTA